jgi:hypothetical protein
LGPSLLLRVRTEGMGIDALNTARVRMVLGAGRKLVLVVGCHGDCGLGSNMGTIRNQTNVLGLLGLRIIILSLGSLPE